MTTKEIADRLAALCRKGEFETAQQELFAADAVSVEQEASPMFAKETKGLPAIIEKGHKFQQMVEKIYAVEVSDLAMAGDSFSCIMRVDADMKGRGRTDMREICVYETANGKIVSERFFN